METRPTRSQSFSDGRLNSSRSRRSEGSVRSAQSSAPSHRSRATDLLNGTDQMRVLPVAHQRSSPASLPKAGQFTVCGLPGYSGYIPGKRAENVYGLNYRATIEQAAFEVGTHRRGNCRPTLPAKMTTLDPGPRKTIPGYSGFVPGKKVNNIIGQSNAKSEETAHMIMEQQKAERRVRVAAYRQGRLPATGTADYAGYHPAGSLPGIDAGRES